MATTKTKTLVHHSKLVVKTADGTHEYLVGNGTTISLDSPAGGLRSGGTFSGFAQRYPNGVNDGDQVVYPSTRITKLAYVKGGGNESSPDAIELTLAGGEGDGAWSKTETVPVNVEADTEAEAAREVHFVPTCSTLTVEGALAGENNPATWSETIPLKGLSSISVKEAA